VHLNSLSYHTTLILGLEESANFILEDNAEVIFTGNGTTTPEIPPDFDLQMGQSVHIQFDRSAIINSEIRITSGNTMTFTSNAHITIGENVWLIIENGATLIIEPGAQVCLEPGAEIIGNPQGTIQCNSDNIVFLGPGSCFYVKGLFTVPANLTITVNNQGLFVIDNGEMQLGDNSKIVFDASSDKLDIRPGSTIKLGDNAEIIVNSKLDAQGTAANPITFTSLYPSPSTGQYWKWLKLDGSQDTDPPPQRIFDNVIIKYADYGIHATQVSDLTLTNSTIQKCWLEGIYLNTSDAYVDNCLINITSFSTANGIHLYDSSPLLYNNIIRDNMGAGVFCYKYSSPEFGASTSTAYGANVLTGNAYGVQAFFYSNPFLGEEYDIEGPVRYGGYNSIYSNSSAAVKAAQYCNITAQYNWWGSYPMDPGIFDIEGDNSSIDYDHALTYDPNQGSGALTTGGSISERSGSSSLPTENFTPRQLLKLAKKFRVQRLPRLALPVYKQLILNYPNRVEARWGLMELLSTFKEAGRDSAVAYLLHTIATHPNLQMQRVAFDMLTGEYLEKRKTNAAVANSQQILSNYPDTESEKIALFDLVNIYLHNLNDPVQAQTYLSQLESKYPNDELTFHAQMLLNGGGSLYCFEMTMS
jgi:tetratricopeptide (TPR) repeat protein